jgi:hypothetical protein
MAIIHIHFEKLNYFSMYVLTYKLLGILRIGDTLLFSYDGFIQEQDVPEHKTTIIGSCTRSVRYDRSHI